jgi:hypothetical protein
MHVTRKRPCLNINNFSEDSDVYTVGKIPAKKKVIKSNNKYVCGVCLEKFGSYTSAFNHYKKNHNDDNSSLEHISSNAQGALDSRNPKEVSSDAACALDSGKPRVDNSVKKKSNSKDKRNVSNAPCALDDIYGLSNGQKYNLLQNQHERDEKQRRFSKQESKLIIENLTQNFSFNKSNNYIDLLYNVDNNKSIVNTFENETFHHIEDIDLMKGIFNIKDFEQNLSEPLTEIYKVCVEGKKKLVNYEKESKTFNTIVEKEYRLKAQKEDCLHSIFAFAKIHEMVLKCPMNINVVSFSFSNSNVRFYNRLNAIEHNTIEHVIFERISLIYHNSIRVYNETLFSCPEKFEIIFDLFNYQVNFNFERTNYQAMHQYLTTVMTKLFEIYRDQDVKNVFIIKKLNNEIRMQIHETRYQANNNLREIMLSPNVPHTNAFGDLILIGEGEKAVAAVKSSLKN